MKKELEVQLLGRYSLLYRRLLPAGYEPFPSFECADGWFCIIDALSAQAEALLTQMRESGTPVDELPAAVQVKEKFGALRAYLRPPGPDELQAYVRAAETRSGATCEFCGQAGTLHVKIRRSHLRTLCPACATARGYQFSARSSSTGGDQ